MTISDWRETVCKLHTDKLSRFIIFHLAVSFMLLGLPSAINAQADLEDVVYLRNGSIIRGVIIEQVPNVSLKIQTRDGSVFVLQMEEISKFTKEPKFGGVSPIQPMGQSAFLFHPLGFLQFGPILEVEYRIESDLYITSHVRFSALGFLYYALASEGFENEVSPGSMALGIGVKKYMDNPNSPNRLYFAGFAEYGWGATRGDIGTQWEWEGKNAQIILASNIGYRFRYPSKFFINLGGMAGVAPGIRDDWWYIDSPGDVYEGSNEINFFGMLELSFGWER